MHFVRARADIVATKLGIILYCFLFFFLSFHVLPWLALAGGVRALWVSEYPPRRTYIDKVLLAYRKPTLSSYAFVLLIYVDSFIIHPPLPSKQSTKCTKNYSVKNP